MIKFRLREVANRRGISNGYQLMKALKSVGIEITPASAQRLWRESHAQESITFRTLDNLCNALECDPVDLIVHIKKKPKK